jgi:hypothetical protein
MSSSQTVKHTGSRGLFASLGIAGQILVGTLRLLRMYPKLILPLLPVFALVLLVEFGLLFIYDLATLMLGLVAILFVAFCLMLSFAVSSNLLKQVHDGRHPSLIQAGFSTQLLRQVPRVFGLSLIWFTLVLLLVIIEMIIRALLDRISDGLGDRAIRAVFGTIADALRMAGFMMVAIMVFEDIGMRPAFGRLRSVVKNEGVTALGGLVLTKLAATIIFGVLYVFGQVLPDTGWVALAGLLMLPLMTCGWVLAMYLEQLFATGLYLYASAPDSPLVQIMMGRFLGNELPALDDIEPLPS